jgi:putative transposase
MTNHVHLLVSPPDIPAISRMMRDINQIFGQRLNRRANRCGSAWEGRFKACLVDTQEYFLTCQRYIELNPVRAGLVAHPSSYPLSSYGANGEGRPSLFVVPHERYLRLGRTPKDRQATYRSLFGQPIDCELLSKIRTAIHRNRPLGDEAFARAVEGRLEPCLDLEAPVPHLSQVPVPYLSRTWPRCLVSR